MSDQRTDLDLETRLRGAFRSADLPAAPGRLVGMLERVPDAPVVATAARDAGRRRGRSTGFGLLGLVAVLLVGGALALSGGARQQTPPPNASATIAGEASASVPPGRRITYQVVWSAAVAYTAPLLAEEVRIVQARIDATGVVGATVRSEGGETLIVDLPADLDADPLRRLIGQTGRIAFVPLDDTQVEQGDVIDPAAHPELFGSEGIATASVSTDQSGGRVVVFELSPAAADLFGAWTASHIGAGFAITLDDRVVSAPVIQSEIPGGTVEISQAGTGGWDERAASELTTIVRLGPLPAPLMEVASGPGPEDPLASGEPTPLVAASGPPVACPDPLVIENPLLTCDRAVQAATEILPAGHAAIASIRFDHACFDPLHPGLALDCAIQASGIVTFSFADGAEAFVAGVRIGDAGAVEAVALTPTAAGGSTFALERTPADLGCDAIPPPYRWLVIHVDPTKTPSVWAIADTKARLRVLWGSADRGILPNSAGAIPTPAAIVDRFGLVIARDGTRIDIPEGAWPALAGRFVCPGPTAVYVTDRPSLP